MKPAAWNLNLLHIRLGGQWDDGLELGAGDSSHSHRLYWFDTLKMRLQKGDRDLSENDMKKYHLSSIFNLQQQNMPTHFTVICSSDLTCVVFWLVATLTGDPDVDCWTVRICWPSATLTGRVTDF